MFKFKFDDLINDEDYGYIFKKDKEFFDKYLKEGQWNKETNIDPNSRDNDNCFQFGLLPQQIVGDINKSKIYLLNLNPSFDVKYFKDFEDESTLEPYINDILHLKYSSKNLKEYPFYFLNPKLKETSGYEWWNNGHHFKSYISIYKNKYKNKDEDYIRKILAKEFCCIELIPYHAKKLPIKKGEAKELPSVKYVKKYVKEVLLPKAKSGKIIIICLRAEKYWLNDFTKEEKKHIYFSDNPQTVPFKLENIIYKDNRPEKKVKEILGIKK